jgi:prepilin-type processing-associated H-X9-DG protein
VTNSKAIRWTPLLHQGAGNLARADGSVQQSETPGLQEILSSYGTNRLALPQF